MVPRLILPRVQVFGRRVGPCKRSCCVPSHALQDVNGQGIHLEFQPSAPAAGDQPQHVRVYGRGTVNSPNGRCQSPDCLGCSCYSVHWAPHYVGRLHCVTGAALQGRGSTGVHAAKMTKGMPTTLLYRLQL